MLLISFNMAFAAYSGSCLRWFFQLRLPSGVACGHLFLLGVLLGFSGGSLLNKLYSLDPADHFGVALLALSFVVFKSFSSSDCAHLVSTLSVTTPLVPVVMKDAVVQVQFIPAHPPLLQPLCVPPVFRPVLPPTLRTNVVMPPGLSIHIYASAVMPVASVVFRESYLPVVMVVRCIIRSLQTVFNNRNLVCNYSWTFLMFSGCFEQRYACFNVISRRF